MLAYGRGQTALYVQVSCKKTLQSWHQSQINIGFTQPREIIDVCPKQQLLSEDPKNVKHYFCLGQFWHNLKPFIDSKMSLNVAMLFFSFRFLEDEDDDVSQNASGFGYTYLNVLKQVRRTCD